MRVMKFGGSSLANVGLFEQAKTLILQAKQQQTTAVVLSAPATITNALVELIELATQGQDIQGALSQLSTHLLQFPKDAQAQGYLSALQTEDVVQQFETLLALWQQRLEGVRLLQSCPDLIYAEIVTGGERLSVALMQALVLASGQKVELIEPLRYFRVNAEFNEKAQTLNALVNVNASKNLCRALTLDPQTLYLMPGFIAGNEQGQTVCLGRNGSDYSAAVLAACLQASRLEIWTDVDGIFSADPRLVPQAKLVPEMSYQEAMELSYFGAKVLHPKTIAPIAQYHIPCFIKNTHNALAQGSRISEQSFTSEKVIKGISNLDGQSMFDISGPGLKGLVGISSRVLNVIASRGVSVNLVSQGSSEYSISFCVATEDALKVEQALKQAFELELGSALMEPIRVQHGLAIISLIGDGMRTNKGVAASFLKALAQAQINIIALAQGASERSISTVILQDDVVMGMRACHQRFFDEQRYLDIFLVGCGNVGAGLLAQISKQQSALKPLHISLRVCGITNSKQMLMQAEGIELENWRQQLTEHGQAYDLPALLQFAKAQQLVNPVLVDCTSSENVANCYLDALQAGLHVVTPNKKANTASLDYYYALKQTALKYRRQFLYETTVGAGLPVVDNLQKLLLSGDKLKTFNGILSGSLSFIFGLLEDGYSISQATQIAREKCFTEPDPRDDLSGMDVARKVLLLARESGLSLELSDVHIESILPSDFEASYSTEDADVDCFMQALPQADAYVADKVAAAQSQGKVLRYVGQIDEQGARVVIAAVDEQDPLYSVKGGENALAFYSHYYQPIPFVLRGYGAGTEVTAAGVFADVLRTLHWEREVM